MDKGYSSAHNGHPCVYLTYEDTKVQVIVDFAADNGAMNDDEGEEKIIVKFPRESSAEAVTREELDARINTLPAKS